MRGPATIERSRNCFERLAHSCPAIIRASLAVITLLICLQSTIAAAEGTTTETEYPLMVFNVASIQRLRDNASEMFDAADRADMLDQVDQWITGTLKDIKGIDRSKPFGMMLYMSPTKLFSMTPISYLPVTDLKEALQTMTPESATLIPVEGNLDRNDILTAEDIRIRTLYRNGYLFLVGQEGDETSLDREFPNPESMTQRLTSQYDIAGSLMIKTIPPGMKTLIVSYFKAAAQGALQQQDGEPESVYRLRRANGEIWIDLAEKIANQGSEIILGARMEPELQQASIEFEIAGTRDSKFAKIFQKMAGKRTAFGNLLNTPATLTTSISIQFDENQRKPFSKYVDVFQKEQVASFKNEEDKADFQKITDSLFKTLRTTFDLGHFDAFGQIIGAGKEQFVLIGGVRYAASRDVPSRVEDLLEFLIDFASDNDPITKFELAQDSIDSLPVHRLKLGHVDQSVRYFGETPYLYVYATPNTLWCAVGADGAMDKLREAVQTAAQPQDPAQAKNQVPVQIILRARNWLLAADEGVSEKSLVGRANSSFTSDNDAMTLEVRPTDSGLRIRTIFQGGFVALMGRNFANGIEIGAFTPPDAETRRNRRNRNQPPKNDEEKSPNE